MKIVLPPTALGELATAKPTAPKTPSAEALKAAHQFESLLVRHMLDSMQKTSHMGASQSHQSDAYQSMAMEALADGVERGGGLGLADLIAKTLEGEVAGRSK